MKSGTTNNYNQNHTEVYNRAHSGRDNIYNTRKLRFKSYSGNENLNLMKMPFLHGFKIKSLRKHTYVDALANLDIV